MSDLLDLALDAHGGLERWRQLNTVAATLAAGGPLFAFKGYPEGLGTMQATADVTKPSLALTPFVGFAAGRFEPDRVVVATDGATSRGRDDPRAAFSQLDGDAPWDELHLLYFAGYALWNYLCAPFLFTRPGFTFEEIAPWSHDSTTWRRLRVTFPPDVPTHNREQVFYFDDQGLLRRLDYFPEVVGAIAAPAAHYCSQHREFSGLVVPTHRRVYVRRDDGTPDTSVAVVEIDISDVTVS